MALMLGSGQRGGVRIAEKLGVLPTRCRPCVQCSSDRSTGCCFTCSLQAMRLPHRHRSQPLLHRCPHTLVPLIAISCARSCSRSLRGGRPARAGYRYPWCASFAGSKHASSWLHQVARCTGEFCAVAQVCDVCMPQRCDAKRSTHAPLHRCFRVRLSTTHTDLSLPLARLRCACQL